MAKSKLRKENKKIEEGVVDRFSRMSNKFVDNYLTKDGESVEEAKIRLAAEQNAREEKSNKEMEERKKYQQEIIEENKKRAESYRY